MRSRLEHLFVIWRAPVEGRRHVIGELWKQGAGEFAFAYAEDLAFASLAGFTPLPAFPEIRTKGSPYHSRYLFSIFAQRIPSPSRPDYEAMLAAWGVEHADSQLTVLAASGGALQTDSLELAEFRASTDDLCKPLEFRMSGERHFEDAKKLSAGDVVTFRRDMTNPIDEHATFVCDREGRPLGYVPWQYSRLFAQLLHPYGHEPVEATVIRRLEFPIGRDRWVLRARASTLRAQGLTRIETSP